MTTTDAATIQSPPPWSLAAPARAASADGHSAGARGTAIARPEELEERRQFSAVLKSANGYRYQAETGTSTTRVAAAPPTANNPEDRWLAERAQGQPGGATDDQAVAEGEAFFGEDGLTFGDVIDIINPLQHLPVVSTLYRSLTGDEISPGARLAGGTLYGGPIGFASALANTISQDISGRDIGDQVMAALFGDSDAVESGISVASAETAVDAAAGDLAQLAPASGASTPAVQSAATQGQTEAQGLFGNAAATPLFTGRSTGNLLSAGPLATGEMPGQVMTAPPMTAPVPTAMAAAAQGVPNLSPQAANILMQMAQQSQTTAVQTHTAAVQARSQPTQRAAADPIVSAPAITPPAEPVATKTPSTSTIVGPITAASGIAAAQPTTASTTASATASAAASVAERAQTAAYIEPIPAQDLPSAMLEALSKYESMKRDG